jgi:hypothetical protein
MKLCESTLFLYCARYYENPHCEGLEEFEADLKRIQYLRKLFARYEACGDLKERLILNHMIILYNVFGIHATNLLFMKLPEFHSLLKPFVVFLNYMPEVIEYSDVAIHRDNIPSDGGIEERLRRI